MPDAAAERDFNADCALPESRSRRTRAARRAASFAAAGDARVISISGSSCASPTVRNLFTPTTGTSPFSTARWCS